MIGVLANNGRLITETGEIEIIGKHGKPAFSMAMWNIGKLLSMAKYYKIKNLWILRDSDFWQNIKHAVDHNIWPQFWTEHKGWVAANGNRKNQFTAWIDGDRTSTTTIRFPAIDGSELWEFDRVTDEYALVLALEQFYKTFQVVPTVPNTASIKIFRKLSLPVELLSDDPKTYWEPFRRFPSSEIIFTRKPNRGEAKKFLHCFDKRSMFLSAMRNTFVGRGAYQQVFDKLFSEITGVGCFEIEPIDWDKPNPVRERPQPIVDLLKSVYEDRGYFFTPELEFISRDMGYNVRVKRGWFWPKAETSRHFEGFAKVVSTAIKSTRGSELPEIQAANAAYKSLYTQFIGWFGRNSVLEMDKPASYGLELYRPDWRGMIISMANANLWRNIVDVYNHYEVSPVGIFHDALFYFSDEPDGSRCYYKASVGNTEKFSFEWTVDGKSAAKKLRAGCTALELDKLGKEENEK